MKCSIKGCPGEYEERQIIHPVRYHGQVIVIDHVPAEVCSVCGDVPFQQAIVLVRGLYWVSFKNENQEVLLICQSQTGFIVIGVSLQACH